MNVTQLAAVIQSAEKVAQSIANIDAGPRRTTSVPPWLERVKVGESKVTLSIDRRGLAEDLAISVRDDALANEERSIRIVVPTRALRRGKQVRLVLGKSPANKISGR